jgi:hypothetical protein
LLHLAWVWGGVRARRAVRAFVAAFRVGVLRAGPAAFGVVLTVASLARAGAPDAPVAVTGEEADLALLADGHSQRTNYQPAGITDRYGRAQILVNAPIGIVHRLVLDYGHYKEFTGGKFHTSRVIGKSAGGTEVYFQLSVMDGMITLWQIFRFQELKPLARGWAMVEGWYVKGNIGRGNAAWTLHAIDDSRTVLTFDLLILPNVPLPQSLLDEGLRNAAGEAVEAIRNRAEEAARPAASMEE